MWKLSKSCSSMSPMIIARFLSTDNSSEGESNPGASPNCIVIKPSSLSALRREVKNTSLLYKASANSTLSRGSLNLSR